MEPDTKKQEHEFKEGRLCVKEKYDTNRVKWKQSSSCTFKARRRLLTGTITPVAFQKPKPSEKFTRCSVIW